MSPAAASLLAVLAVGCARSPEPPPSAPAKVRVSRAPAPAPGQAAADLEPPYGLIFAFHAGTPLSGPPGIAADGSVLAGTADGYLYALRPDGSFRWSYTLRGRVVGRPTWTSDGLALASAQRNGLYALDSEGSLVWVTSIPDGVTSAPVVAADGKIWVTTGGGTLLAYSRRGGISGFARIGPAAALGPVLLESGEVAVASAEGSLRVAGPFGRARSAQCDAPLRELRAGAGGLFALGAGGLARFEASPLEERWVRAEVSGIACTGPMLVAIERGSARWLSAAGEPGPALPLPAGAASATACLGDGSLLLANEKGALHKLSRSGASHQKPIPPGRVLGLDVTAAGLVIVSYQDGRLIGIEPP